MSYKLSSRLLATTALALIGTVAALTMLVTQFVYMEPSVIIGHELEKDADNIIKGIRFLPDGSIRRVNGSDLMLAMYQRMPGDGAYRILDEAGKVLISSDGAIEPFRRAGEAFPPLRKPFDVGRAGFRQHAYTKTMTHGGRAFYVQVMRSDRVLGAMLNVRRERSSFLLAMIILVPMAVFSIVVLSTLHKRMLKPLRRATSAAAEIGPHNLGARLSTSGLPHEITPLIASFNLTLDRLEHGFTVQREFLAAAAHELKTPIALMRGQIELDGLQDREMLLQDLDHMARLVHQLLHLAEASERQNYKFLSIDAASIIDEVVGHLDRLAQQHKVDIDWLESDERVTVLGDSGGLFILLRNLIENAIHHAPPGTSVAVRLTKEGFSIQDAGPGIDPAVLPHIFQRFWRGPHRRDSGAGLGLSICREIVTVHGWEIQVENLYPGARFAVRF